MDSFFDTEMPAIKLGSLDNIPCSSRKLGGGRDVKSRKYPNRNGQSGEDMGREPYTFDLEIPLFAGVDANHYPTMADQLRSILDDPPDPLEYRDHELGTLNVTIEPYTSDLVSEKRDGVVFRIKLVEDQLDAPSQFRELTSAPNAQNAGDTLDQELEEAGVSEPNVITSLDRAGVGLTNAERGFAAGQMWTSLAIGIVNVIQEGVATAEQIGSMVDTTRARVDVVLGLPQVLDPANGSAMTAAILFLEAITLLGDVALASAAIEVEEEILDVCSVFQVAARLYGDELRAIEIMQRNPGINALFIPRGTRLVVATA